MSDMVVVIELFGGPKDGTTVQVGIPLPPVIEWIVHDINDQVAVVTYVPDTSTASFNPVRYNYEGIKPVEGE